jgi:hypothetical protein
MSIRVDLLDIIRSSQVSKNLDVNLSARRALNAFDKDQAESFSFWLRHMGMCMDVMFEKSVKLKVATPEDLKRYKQEMSI